LREKKFNSGLIHEGSKQISNIASPKVGSHAPSTRITTSTTVKSAMHTTIQVSKNVSINTHHTISSIRHMPVTYQDEKTVLQSKGMMM
jgi:hypothetical protein